MSKHTPGPWTALKENRGAIPEHFRPWSVVAVHPELRKECVICRLPDESQQLGQANARLIAAAPDLLAALEAIVSHADAGRTVTLTLDDGMPRIADCDAARAAIQKARGKD